jgi:hypothetical protein
MGQSSSIQVVGDIESARQQYASASEIYKITLGNLKEDLAQLKSLEGTKIVISVTFSIFLSQLLVFLTFHFIILLLCRSARKYC